MGTVNIVKKKATSKKFVLPRKFRKVRLEVHKEFTIFFRILIVLSLPLHFDTQKQLSVTYMRVNVSINYVHCVLCEGYSCMFVM